MRKRSSPRDAALSQTVRVSQSLVDTVRLGDAAAHRGPHSPHQMELEVQRRLLAHPDLRFSSLVIRRTPNGVCLEGVLEVDDESSDVRELVRRVAGVDQVMNHLVVRKCTSQAEPTPLS